MKNTFRYISLLTLFSISMGFMETTVVVYLRRIYYPHGFHFPLVNIDADIALAELIREAATIVMLVVAGVLAGKTRAERFAYFLFCFAVWDLFYYVFLKLLLDWPESWLTWDILFLIPVPWAGPVLAPCILSLSMLVLAVFILYSSGTPRSVRLVCNEWMLFSAGSLIVIWTFIQEYFVQTRSIVSPGSNPLAEIPSFISPHFDWYLFSLGELIIVLGIVAFRVRVIKK